MNRIKAALAALLVLFVAGGVFAQARAPLTIIASEGPAQVMLNGRVVGVANPSLTVQFAPGRYELIVRKPGMPDFAQTIVLPAQGLTVQARLGAARPTPPPRPAPQPMFTLSINSNVPNARVAINGSLIGQSPATATLAPGSYQLEVTAPGFEPYTTTVVVNGNATHTANLRQMTNRLSVSANVGGAEVFINNVKAGNAPFTADLAPGSYNLRVAAAGYQDFNTTIVMSGPQTVPVSLVPLFSTLSVNIPAQFLNRETGNPAARIDLFIDGAKINGLSAQIQPGQRTIRVVSGGLSVESVLTVEPGRTYTIEPALSLNIR